jgi:hypothetical protein
MFKWFEKVGASVTSAVKGIVNSDLVQGVASAVGLGTIATVAKSVVNGGSTSVAQTVTTAPVVATVATAVASTPASATTGEVVTKSTTGSGSMMPLLMVGGLGLGALMLMRR